MSTATPSTRHGIAAAGNWIVDRVKTVDCLPGRGMLANILGETVSPGGAPANVLADLARLGTPYPLVGLGMVGADANGDYLRETFADLGVDTSRLVASSEAPTSYTDVMNDAATGDRVFYHHRGANARFAPEHVPIAPLSCRIFHLGYLLLLDAMDAPDPECGTVAARLLRDVRAAGILASVDVVSEEGDRFRSIVPPALKHTDYLIINEIEAGRITGRQVRDAGHTLDADALTAAVEALLGMGGMAMVAIHMPEGYYVQERSGRRHAGGSLHLPSGYIVGAVGAGDAFCAGMLHGLHEGWPLPACADLGSCCAAACLAMSGASEGLRPLDDILALGRRFPRRPAPVAV
jgi:sugar/nucleoside kinase (ribokinase family)